MKPLPNKFGNEHFFFPDPLFLTPLLVRRISQDRPQGGMHGGY